MKPKEIKALVKILKSSGVTHFKTAELELTFVKHETIVTAPVEVSPVNTKRVVKRRAKAIKVTKAIKDESETPHELVELSSLLKLSDTELLDQMFPDYTTGGAEEPATAG